MKPSPRHPLQSLRRLALREGWARVLLGLWLAFGLLVAPIQAAQHGAAMALAQEVCSAAGALMVDANGQPLADGAGTHAGHDCCTGGLSGLPSSVPTLVAPSLPLPNWQPSAVAATPALALGVPPARGPPGGLAPTRMPH
ncbi:DUF2946 family protein [Rivibacter subsaxonicus]|uniref:DUF2946 family protein n=1 Tax=Rivibacter subsaxonicus TaxID=457575 RepID=A0A4Q7W0Y1_9BURK|nr:DUF2946 family protein [Rivibacter subsaxonicus]RZU02495.1 hypothetical protein EV670_0519 [Rivibacter subsaxonicus]